MPDSIRLAIERRELASLSQYAMRAADPVRTIFRHYLEPDRLSTGYVGVQGAIDYVAGMTDRFAIDTFEALRLPQGWRARWNQDRGQ